MLTCRDTDPDGPPPPLHFPLHLSADSLQEGCPANHSPQPPGGRGEWKEGGVCFVAGQHQRPFGTNGSPLRGRGGGRRWPGICCMFTMYILSTRCAASAACGALADAVCVTAGHLAPILGEPDPSQKRGDTWIRNHTRSDPVIPKRPRALARVTRPTNAFFESFLWRYTCDHPVAHQPQRDLETSVGLETPRAGPHLGAECFFNPLRKMTGITPRARHRGSTRVSGSTLSPPDLKAVSEPSTVLR